MVPTAQLARSTCPPARLEICNLRRWNPPEHATARRAALPDASARALHRPCRCSRRGTTPALRGHLLLLGRTSNGWLGQSLSSDYGSTWTAAVENTQLSHPQAPPNLALLPDGRLLLVTEPHFVPEEKMLVSAATVG